MVKARIPSDVTVLVEVGTQSPTEVSYDTFSSYSICWVLTNGIVRKKYLWLVRRPSGFYIAHGMPGGVHLSYHQDGKCHSKIGKNGEPVSWGDKPSLDSIKGAVSVVGGSGSIADDILKRGELAYFNDEAIDRVIYLDNRKLPGWLSWQVWLVEPFRHGEIPLMIDKPVHFHLLTHTIPWVAILIYEPRSLETL